MERERGARARARRPSRAGREGSGFLLPLTPLPPTPRGKHLEPRHRARTPPPPPPPPRPTHPRLGQGPDGGVATEERTEGAPPRSRGRRFPGGAGERTEEPAVGRRAETYVGRPPADLGYHRRPPPPPPERARARHASIREEPASQQPALAAPAVPPRFGWCGERKTAKDKPLCRGLTLNRSQRGSCSATYETPTQKQVVYEWFSARFHTNVRSTRRARGRPPFRPRPDSRDEWLSAPDPGPDARRGTRPRLRRTPARGPRRPTRTDRRRGRTGTRLSGADRGSRGAAVSFRLGGILT